MRQFEQPADERELDLRHYLAVAKRRKFLIIGVTIVIAAAALLSSLVQTPLYRSTAEVLLSTRASQEILTPTQGQREQSDTIVDTEIEVMRSRSVEQAVEKELGLVPSVNIEARGETYVVAITAIAPDPEEAARIANTYAEIYVKIRREARIDDLLAASEQVQAQLTELDAEIAELDQELAALDNQIAAAGDSPSADAARADRDRLAERQQVDRLSIANRRTTYTEQLDQLRLSSDLARTGGGQIVSEAAPASEPFRPAPLRTLVLALVAGLLLGLGAAFLRDYLDDSISSRDVIERVLPGVDLLAVVPQYEDWKDRKAATLVSMSAPNSPTAEAYRTLRTSLQFVGIDQSVKITQVTSANPGEGKSTTLANLGVQLARTGRRVIMVDCDLRRPRIHHFFGFSNATGFTSVLLGEAQLDEALIPVPGERNLMVLPSGPVPPNPSELLSLNRTGEVFRTLGEQADFVLVDSPPILPVSDALVLSRVVDSTILVLSAGSTSQRQAHRAWEQLAMIEAPLIGAVFNAVDEQNHYDGRYGTYGYVYGDGPDEPRSRWPWQRRDTKPSEGPAFGQPRSPEGVVVLDENSSAEVYQPHDAPSGLPHGSSRR